MGSYALSSVLSSQGSGSPFIFLAAVGRIQFQIRKETRREMRLPLPTDADADGGAEGRCPLCANVTGAIRNRNAVAFGVSDRKNDEERGRERERERVGQ